MRAYLSGAMEFAKDEGASWREDMTVWLDQTLGHSVYNPVIESQNLIKEYGAEDYREWKQTDLSRYTDFIRTCVNRDISTVRNSVDYLICLWDESVFKGAGTHAEVTLAYDTKKPVYLVNTIPVSDLSGWIMACSTEIFTDFDQLKLFLSKRYKKN
ncbi:MAG: hypothetical protein QF842_04620 [Candidatus Marinimicrobia bacterium]|jgi:hypothetical protein|nr:hypothetical protein [Candidatus Neomarinimicrobiota bacterium]MDP6612103.1 hypothetical protein [Candidatus Neomarinimicrobiota bacterium]|tara:strand:- start:20356 stop:20823 length:468 start_codon:yes stop_codon:yes gene_type:complete